MKKIFLETFGCQMNVLDSELVRGQLHALGYEFIQDPDGADVVLYNTCSVRQHSEDKVLSRLGRMKIRKTASPELVVGVLGCMAERDGLKMLKRLPQVDILCGPGELDKLPMLLHNAFLTGKQQAALAGNTSRRSGTVEGAADSLEALDLSRSFSPHENKYQAYVRVVRGCNKFCTYCVVPYTRGPEVSRSPQAIIDESRRLVDAGAREITLLGQTVNHYLHHAKDSANGITTTFAQLLYELHEAIPSLPRLRFVTSFPADFGDDILHVMAACKRICPYLHVPAQSGSNRILKLMNRGYTVEQYLSLVERARQIVPGIALAGDFIVGFPTETEADYLATRDLLEKVRLKNCFIFKYSPRPGTVAIRRHPDDVPEDEKRRRNNDLLDLQNQIILEANKTMVDSQVEVLCEGPSGWKRTGDVHPAGPPTDEHHGDRIELGAALARGLKSAQKRETPDASFTESPDRERLKIVQMTGRTTCDQIVVFDAPTTCEGQIVKVKIRATHGMTLFASVEKIQQVSAEDAAVNRSRAFVGV